MALKVEQPAPPEPPIGGPPRRYNSTLLAAAVAAVLIIGGLAVYAFTRDNGSDTTVAGTTETTASGSSSSAPSTEATTGSSTDAATSTTATSTSTSTASSVTTTSTSAGQSSTVTSTPARRPDVIWPSPESATRFTTPTDAARSFAVDLAGFTDPVIGPFSDENDGMVEIQPDAAGTITTVFVRLDPTDNTWWVVGAESPDIQLATPAANDTVSGSMRLTGGARAFEGQVTVDLHIDGQTRPVLTDFVTGRGDGVLGDFDKTIEIPPDVTGHGFLILTSANAKDGSPVTVAAIPLSVE